MGVLLKVFKDFKHSRFHVQFSSTLMLHPQCHHNTHVLNIFKILITTYALCQISKPTRVNCTNQRDQLTISPITNLTFLILSHSRSHLTTLYRLTRTLCTPLAHFGTMHLGIRAPSRHNNMYSCMRSCWCCCGCWHSALRAWQTGARCRD